MDTTYGVLCLIPPIVAIGLALWTKQTIFSLFIAVWLGSTMMNGFNPLVGFVKIISDYMIPSLSQAHTLKPGDLCSCGTVISFNEKEFDNADLRSYDGKVLESYIEHIGTMKNHIKAI